MRRLQVHHGLRSDEPHRGILGELLRGLGVREWRKEADLLLDTFGSIRYWGARGANKDRRHCDSSSIVTRFAHHRRRLPIRDVLFHRWFAFAVHGVVGGSPGIVKAVAILVSPLFHYDGSVCC